MALFHREEILARLRAKVAAGQPIVGGGAGTGISAKMSEAGGIDLLDQRHGGLVVLVPPEQERSGHRRHVRRTLGLLRGDPTHYRTPGT